MSIDTRWPKQGGTTELVDLPIEFDFHGAVLAPTRTPMIVDGKDEAAGIQGNQISGIDHGGVGLFNINLREPVAWLLGDSLKVCARIATVVAPYTVELASDLTFQTATPGAPAFVRMRIWDSTGVLADPPDGFTLRGEMTFRNRRTGS